MLEDVYKSYRKLADNINWRMINQNELFYGYIKNEGNLPIRDSYYSAIVCRYWGYTGKIYLQCNKHVPFEQCYDILIDTINYVLEKRVWENPKNSLYNDYTAPDKAFHVVLKRQRSLLLTKLNAEKRKTNFNTLSIDEIHEKYADAAEGLFNLIEEDNLEWQLMDFIKTHDTLEIIILDKICFDTWKDLKEIVTSIKNLNKDDVNYYNSRYGIPTQEFNNLLTQITIARRPKLMKEIKKLLHKVRNQYFEREDN